MKKLSAIIVIVLMLTMVFAFTGCGGSSDSGSSEATDEQKIVGTWNYADEEYGITAVYDFKDDGTGTYNINTGEGEVTYEMNYELSDGHLLITFVNNDTFTEDDVFDHDYHFDGDDTLFVSDDFGEELEFTRQ